MFNSWAAKEAAIKAYPHHVLSRHDITITRPPRRRDSRSQAPAVFVQLGRVVEGEMGEMETETEVKVSISHDGEYATAVCLAPAEEA
jgi:holo-[acyl-carrier protein] synthase